MKIKSLHIKNFKSIVDLTINEPNPFTVFVGPNGSGKSNIFEALEFLALSYFPDNKAIELFGGEESFLPNKKKADFFELDFFIDRFHISTKKVQITDLSYGKKLFKYLTKTTPADRNLFPIHNLFIKNHSRLFIKNERLQKINYRDSERLTLSCDNLEKVLKRLLENKEKREEISEWLELFLPEFDRIEVQKNEFSSNENLLIYQKHYERPFNKELISDGTYNIIALLTAVYQSDEPQFLCIEEPENGLHPQVIKELVNFFRWACEEKGHYIWLNTHSETLVNHLTTDEIILVDKVKGETKIQQLKGRKLYDLPASDAWLSGALGGGVVW